MYFKFSWMLILAFQKVYSKVFKCRKSKKDCEITCKYDQSWENWAEKKYIYKKKKKVPEFTNFYSQLNQSYWYKRDKNNLYEMKSQNKSVKTSKRIQWSQDFISKMQIFKICFIVQRLNLVHWIQQKKFIYVWIQ